MGCGMEERLKRVAANESVFRGVNQQLVGLRAEDDRLSIVCECGEITCVESIRLEPEEYRRLRAEPTTFGVKPGHEKPDAEVVIERHEGFNLVRKKPGPAAELARETASEEERR
jgi:hypothetical protein